MGGIVRGGFSFALVLSLGEDKEVLKITVLALVILGTLIFGTVLPLWVMLMDVQERSGSIIDSHDPMPAIEEKAEKS